MGLLETALSLIRSGPSLSFSQEPWNPSQYLSVASAATVCRCWTPLLGQQKNSDDANGVSETPSSKSLPDTAQDPVLRKISHGDLVVAVS